MKTGRLLPAGMAMIAMISCTAPKSKTAEQAVAKAAKPVVENIVQIGQHGEKYIPKKLAEKIIKYFAPVDTTHTGKSIKIDYNSRIIFNSKGQEIRLDTQSDSYRNVYDVATIIKRNSEKDLYSPSNWTIYPHNENLPIVTTATMYENGKVSPYPGFAVKQYPGGKTIIQNGNDQFSKKGKFLPNK